MRHVGRSVLSLGASLVLTAAGAGACAGASAQADAPGDEHLAPVVGQHRPTAVPGRYIVVLRSQSSPATTTAAARQAVGAGAAVTARYHAALEGFAARLPAAALDALRHNPAVAYVEADQEVHAGATEYDPPWGLDRIDQHRHRRNGKYVYDDTGAGVRAYVVDTGIRSTHRQLGGRVATGFTAIQDGRGTEDCDGHGTHVAGTIGSATYGVAKQVTLVPVRVLDCYGDGYDSDVIAGIDWVTKDHVAQEQHGTAPAVANMSIEGGASDAEDLAVTNSVVHGITYAVAAGNDGTNACSSSPARTGPVLTVGATTASDLRAGFSNYGRCVDLFAPGLNVVSTWDTSDRATAVLSGTSMASPHVTGAAALYLEQYPLATPPGVMQALLDGATGGALSRLGKHSPDRLLYSRVSTPPDSPAGSNLLLNPGFESGDRDWIASRGVITTKATRGAHTGSWEARLDGRGTAHTDVLAQQVTLPLAPSARLGFWLHVETAETAGTARDRLKVQVLLPDGTTRRLGTFSNLDAADGYVSESFDLGAYAGTSVTVELTGVEDGSASTTFVVDDASVTAS